MITSYTRNPDGTVTFKDENGLIVVNSPAGHPMAQGKMAELGPRAEQPDRPIMAGPQEVPLPPDRFGHPRGQAGAPPRGIGGFAHGFADALAGRGTGDRGDRCDRFAELAGGAPGNPAIDPASNPYGGQQQRYDMAMFDPETRANMARAAAERANQGFSAPPPKPAPVPTRQPGPGEMIDPATGAVIPIPPGASVNRMDQGFGG